MNNYVALYCRLSPRPDGSYEGVELQEQWGRDYAAKTWPGVEVRAFKDAGLSAAKDDVVRPGFNELRAAIDRGEVRHLWAVEQSRLERREVEWFQLAAELQAAQLPELHTNRDGIVRVRDVVAGIKAVLNADEVRKLKRRVNDTLDARAAAGIPPGSRPFGYQGVGRRESRTYVIVEEQAALIRWAAEKVLAGWSMAHVTADLRAKGAHGSDRMKVKDAEGRVLLDDGRYVDKNDPAVAEHAVTRVSTLSQQAVRGWLLNPSVAGLRVHRGEIIGPGNWEPILERATWEQVRALLTAPRVVQTRDGADYAINVERGPAGRRYLLTGGLAVCGVCGAPLTGTQKQLYNARSVRTVPYLVCHPKTGGRACIGAMLEPIEQYVADELFTTMEDDPGFAAALAADQHAERRAELADDLARIAADRVADARRKARREITDAEWLAMREVYAEDEARIQAELREVPAPPVGAGGVDWRTMRVMWDVPGATTLDERRAFLRRYIKVVTVHRSGRGVRVFNAAARVHIDYREM